MCGIVGRVSMRGPVARDAFERMTDRLAHRGPDGRGTWYGRADRVALGHRRLAILDLTPAGAQPMTLPGSGLWLTYNGEIYNHPALQVQLEAKGHVYRSRCDSETILHAYAEWGTDCVERLAGIFAFAIWDEGAGRLFAARDQIGVKPLYLVEEDGTLAFASQPAAFLDLPSFDAAPDAQAMLDYMTYGVVPGTRGAFAGVTKLPPAHALVWQDGRMRQWRYWALPAEPDIHDADTATALLEETLDAVVTSQLASDVPVATFLSGGIDSSLLSAIATERSGGPVTAYTIGFDSPRFDERAFAATAAKAIGARPVVAVMTEDELDRTFDDVARAYDEPFGINSALPMVRIARLASEHGTRVVLGGDGADELFAGYRHYDAFAAYYRQHGRATGDARAKGLIGKLRGLLAPFDPLSQYRAHNGRLAGQIAETMAGPALRDSTGGAPAPRRHRERLHLDLGRGPVDAARRADIATYLTDEILTKVDRATMAYGIEARVPLIDPRLAQLAFRIAPALHYAGGERKALLKRVGSRWVPPAVLSARKRGFTPPVADWLQRPARQADMRARIRDGRLVAAGIVRRDGFDRAIDALDQPLTGLLNLYLLERWAERWAGPSNPGPA